MTAITKQDTSAVVFSEQGMEAAMSLAKQLATSGLIPKPLQGKPGDVLVVLLTGREFGLGPMQSLRSLHVVNGKAVMAADLMVGLCLGRPEVCEYFTQIESTDKRATYETKRRGAPAPVRLSFTMEEATRAGVAGKDVWRQYPAAMLRARCSAALARSVYQDLTAGLYDPDELDVAPATQPERGMAGLRTTLKAVPADAPAPKSEPKVLSAGPVVGFGAFKGQPLAALTVGEKEMCLDEGESKLAEAGPKDRWANALRKNLEAIRESMAAGRQPPPELASLPDVTMDALPISHPEAEPPASVRLPGEEG